MKKAARRARSPEAVSTIKEVVRAFLAVPVIIALLFAQMAQAQVNLPTGSPLSRSGRDQDNDNNENQTERSQSQTPGAAIDPTGKIEPYQPVEIKDSGNAAATVPNGNEAATPSVKRPAEPNEFERYVETALGRKLPRFGANFLVPESRDFALPATATVPPDYVLNVGDIVAISLTGSTEGSVERQIDTDGKIFLPRVGSVMLAGVRYGDLKDVIAKAIGTQYRGFDVTVGVRQLRGIRVYVTGFANNPGAYSVNSLSTMLNAALAAGGPSSGGSYRSMKLFRHGQMVADFDLYDLVRGGSRTGDAVLQNEDVLYIEPLGSQVAVTGSVNDEAIYEVKQGETISDVLRYAGGMNDLADESRVMLYRTADPSVVGAREISVTSMDSLPLMGGDLLQILSEGTLQRPLAGQTVLVRVEGEVKQPGNYYLPSNSTFADAMAKAGGPTDRAFLYGTKFERNSVKEQQRASFAEAVRQLEISLAAAPITNGQSLDAGERANQLAGARAVLDRLRESEPDGRVVLDIKPGANSVPAGLTLENNDRIVIPPRSTTVGVFGSVYRPASFYLDPYAKPMRVSDYIERAGGPMRSADKGRIFVVRANGSVLSKDKGALRAYVLPGDVIFVPVKTQSTSIWARIREISTVIFQLGISAAALAAIK